MSKVKLVETENQRRLHIGSFFTDLNEVEYQELIKIFGNPNRILKDDIEMWEREKDEAHTNKLMGKTSLARAYADGKHTILEWVTRNLKSKCVGAK